MYQNGGCAGCDDTTRNLVYRKHTLVASTYSGKSTNSGPFYNFMVNFSYYKKLNLNFVLYE